MGRNIKRSGWREYAVFEQLVLIKFVCSAHVPDKNHIS